MTAATTGANRAPRPSSLADVLDLVLDKGVVIDAYARVSLVGIELLTLDARIVVASVDTYLRFAEAAGRLDLGARDDAKGLPQLLLDTERGAARGITRHALRKPADKAARAAGKMSEAEDKVEDKVEQTAGEVREKVGRAREKIGRVRDRIAGGDDQPEGDGQG